MVYTCFRNRNVWLGLQYNSTAGAYSWVDGSTVTFTSWEPQELTGTRCAAISPPSNKWITLNCQHYYAKAVCAKRAGKLGLFLTTFEGLLP